jgi:hypothetical protein
MVLGILLNGPPSSPLDFLIPYVSDTPRQTIFLGAIAFITGLIQAIISRVHFRAYKEITYTVPLEEPVAVPGFNDTYLVHVRLSNTGPSSIDIGDYAWFKILFPGRRVVPNYPPSIIKQTGVVIDDRQANTLFTMHPTIPEEDRIELDPFLFQPKEAFTVSTFVIGSRGNNPPPQVSAKFRPDGKAYPPRITVTRVLRMVLIVSLSLTIIWGLSFFQNVLPFGKEPNTIIILIGYTLLIIGFVILYRLRIIKL